jgi:ligand-binding SRPBCC domain-containing protein
MPVYQRRTRVAAPLDEVWEFHSTVGGLLLLTPDWMNLRVEEIRGQGDEGDEGDGDEEDFEHGENGEGGATEPEVLEIGTRVRLSVRPFGVGPRRGWTSRIIERERGDGSAMFRDDMAGGPFERWVHTHRFFADGEETVLVDRVEYELPFRPAGERLGPLAKVGFEPMFRYRHRKTKDLLES